MRNKEWRFVLRVAGYNRRSCVGFGEFCPQFALDVLIDIRIDCFFENKVVVDLRL